MTLLPLLLQLIALVCLLFAAFNLFPPAQGRPVWGWLGMFLWLLSLMVSGIVLHQAGYH
jgi:hypothetical protein